jgi:hypothetical protein
MIKWDVEVQLRQCINNEELDYRSLPYKSETILEVLGYAQSWFPLQEGQKAVLMIRHRPSGREAVALIHKSTVKLQKLWVVVDGQSMRAQDAIRVLMAQLERGKEVLGAA